MKQLYLLLTTLLFLTSFINKAEAIPSFARKTSFSCSVCHSPSIPRLNSFGWRFKENGYQFKGGDNTFQEQVTMKMDSNLELLKNIPFALRIRSNIQVRNDETKIDFQLPKEIEFLAGGRVFEDVSVFYSQALGTTLITPESIEKGFVAFSNIGKLDLFNIRFGKFNLMEWHIPYDKSLTYSKYSIQNNLLSSNSFKLDSNQIGVEMYGRPFDGNIFYHIGLVNGNYSDILENSFDNNTFKDITGGLNFSIDSHRIGVWGYYGKNRFLDKKVEPMRITNVDLLANKDVSFYNTGLSINLNFDSLSIQGIYALSQNLDQVQSLIHGGFLEAIYSYQIEALNNTNFVTLVRYENLIDAQNNNKMSQSITGSFQVLPLLNLNIALEYNHNLSDPTKNLGLLKMDLAF